MKRGFGLHVGSSSILVVFVLLCLTTFATLSMVSANADYRLIQKSADASERYYRADTAAEGLVARLDRVLSDMRASTSSEEEYRSLGRARLAACLDDMVVPESWGVLGDDAQFVDGADGRYYGIPYQLGDSWLSFQIPLDDAQALEVMLELPYAPAGEPLYRRTRWQVILLGGDEQDDDTVDLGDGMELWDGSDLSALLG